MSDTSDLLDLDRLAGSTTQVLLFCADDARSVAGAIASELEWYARKGVDVVLVTTDGDIGEPILEPVVRVVDDRGGDLNERFWPGGHAWPATVVLDRDGGLIARIEGGAPEVHLERLRDAVAVHVASR